MTLILTVSFVSIACVATTLSLAFAYHRGAHAKNLIAKGWNFRRREVLYLGALNGFDFLREKLHEWSAAASKLAAISVFLIFISDQDNLVLAAALVSTAFAYHYLARLHIARTRREQADLPLEYDGFGSYARATAHWNRERLEIKPVAVCWVVAALSFWALYFAGLKALESQKQDLEQKRQSASGSK